MKFTAAVLSLVAGLSLIVATSNFEINANVQGGAIVADGSNPPPIPPKTSITRPRPNPPRALAEFES